MYLSKLESEMLFGLLIHSGIGRVSPGGWNAFSGYCVFAYCRSAGKGCVVAQIGPRGSARLMTAEPRGPVFEGL